MIALPRSEEWMALARRVIWFEEPERALSDPYRFVAYAITYAAYEDVRMLRTVLDDDALRAALGRVPPGIVDARSWHYWNAKLGRWPPPPLPSRVVAPIAAGE